MGELPSGVVTFVFTDIEDSTPLFERLGDRYRAVHARHNELLRDAFSRHGGHEMRTEGDSFFVVFADPSAAVMGCVEAQRALAAEPWPHGVALRVRMGVHAGPATPVDGEYTALSVHTAARVMAAGNGGQIVVSDLIRDMARDLDVKFVDTGPHRLRGLSDPLRLLRVRAEGMPDDERPLRTARVVTSNVPVVTEQLVGRDEILEQLCDLLERNRCLTLTGTGGVGKTKLALLAAASAGDRYPDGNWFVDLQALRNDDDVAAAAAGLLQADESVAPLEGVVRAVGSGLVLLVLDNCEHLLGGVAELSTAVLRSCPHASILATSREPLGIPGEVSWRVPSLDSTDSLALLIDRISAARGAYAPSAADREALVEIARRLDGIPLALELAAARCAAMAPVDVAARLSQRFRLLTGGSRSSLSRHQTLEAAVMWSFDLLDAPTKVVFRRLAVFVDGWTLSEAERVCGLDDLDAFDVDDAVGALADKSLVVADLDANPARYRFLETMRQFAQAELLRSGETEAVHDAHLATFLALAERLDVEIPGPGESTALARLGTELDNIGAALDWAEAQERVADLCSLAAIAQAVARSLGRGHDVTLQARRALPALEHAPPGVVPAHVHARLLIAIAADDYSDRSSFELGRQRVEQACALVAAAPEPPPDLAADCAGWLGAYVFKQGDPERGAALVRAAIDTPGIRSAVRAALTGNYARMLLGSDFGGEEAAAVAAFEETLILADAAGTTRTAAGALLGLALAAAVTGDLERVDEMIDRFLPYASALPAENAAEALGQAAAILTRVDRFDRAEKLAQQSVELATASGLGGAVATAGLAAGDVAAARGDYELAEREWLAVVALAARQSRTGPAWMAYARLHVLYTELGDASARQAMLDAARPAAEQLGGMPWAAWHLNLGEVLLASGNRVTALAEYRLALSLADAESPRWPLAVAVSVIADLCADMARLEDAARLAGMSRVLAPRELQRATQNLLRRQRSVERDRFVEQSLGAQRVATLAEEGKAMTLDDVYVILDALFAPGDGNS